MMQNTSAFQPSLDGLDFPMLSQELIDRLMPYQAHDGIRQVIAQIEAGIAGGADRAEPDSAFVEAVLAGISNVLDVLDRAHDNNLLVDLKSVEFDLLQLSNQLRTKQTSRSAAAQWALLHDLAEEGVIIRNVSKLLDLLASSDIPDWQLRFLQLITDGKAVGVSAARQLAGRDVRGIRAGMLRAGFSNEQVELFLTSVKPTIRSKINKWLSQPRVSLGLTIFAGLFDMVCNVAVFAFGVLFLLRLTESAWFTNWTTRDCGVAVAITTVAMFIPGLIAVVGKRMLRIQGNTAYSPTRARLK